MMSAAVAGLTSIRPIASYTTLRDMTRDRTIALKHQAGTAIKQLRRVLP
jgi:hypothetical protein